MHDLKQRTVRGGVARLLAQAASFLLRLGSLMILARLLVPKDFGLVGMVTAFTGILTLFRDFGLSAAAVQRASVTEEQMSTLFWINMFVGVALALAAIAGAPAIAAFYHERRLLSITVALSLAFLFNAAGIQHSALLQRHLRFTSLSMIAVVALFISTAIAIAAAKAGYGYWSLVAMALAAPLISTIGFWLMAGWIPGMPRRGAGIRSMMRFGTTITLNGLVAYLAYNVEKILLGRFWGADAIGIYGRAYQLINIPTENLNSAVGEVAFSALSRVQDEPARLSNYFLKGYSLVLGLTLPITITCAFFADDLVFVLLGPKWKEAASIFRLLAPTIAIFAIINPLGWLLNSLGMVRRGLNIALVFAPVMIAGCLMGLPSGPKGVAIAYSTVMALWVVPLTAWCVHGTMIRVRDIFAAACGPLASGIFAGVVSFGIGWAFLRPLSPLPRIIIESAILWSVYLGSLLFVVGQKSLYWDILRALKAPSSIDQKNLVSA